MSYKLFLPPHFMQVNTMLLVLSSHIVEKELLDVPLYPNDLSKEMHMGLLLQRSGF